MLKKHMRFTVVLILIVAAMHPLLIHSTLDNGVESLLHTDAGNVDIIQEVEPNNLNTTAQEVYPGDVVRGSVDMWSDELDYYGVWLEPGQTLLLTL